MTDESAPAGDLPPLEVLDEFWEALRGRELAGDGDVELEQWIQTWAVDHGCDVDALVEHAARTSRDRYFEDDRDVGVGAAWLVLVIVVVVVVMLFLRD